MAMSKAECLRIAIECREAAEKREAAKAALAAWKAKAASGGGVEGAGNGGEGEVTPFGRPLAELMKPLRRANNGRR